MHFSIPEYEESEGRNQPSFTAFKIYVNGVHHCSARFSELFTFYRHLEEVHGKQAVPPFPPKKLFQLSPSQLDERRLQLEAFIQTVSQDPVLGVSDEFSQFLQESQRTTYHMQTEPVVIDIYLMNGKKKSLAINSTDKTEDVLEKFLSSISLPDELVYYFGLFMMSKDSKNRPVLKRKLQEFELPYLAVKNDSSGSSKHECQLVIRKAYWDSVVESSLYDNEVALNLLYSQAVSDLNNGWILPTKEEVMMLTDLKKQKSLKDFMRLAKTCRVYGFVPFWDCVCDWPSPNTPVNVWAGQKELIIKVAQDVEDSRRSEAVFRVVRMRRWKLITRTGSELPNDHCDELNFEYLVAPDVLKWFKINSNQVILMSMCLQSMVDEVLMKKRGGRLKTPADRRRESAPNILTPSKIFVPQTGGNSLPSRFKWSKSQPLEAGYADNSSFDGAIGDDDL